MAIFTDLIRESVSDQQRQQGYPLSDDFVSLESTQFPGYRVTRDIDALTRRNQNRSERSALTSSQRNIQTMGPEGMLTQQGILTGDIEPGENYLDDFSDEIALDSKRHKTEGLLQTTVDVLQTPLYMITGGVLEMMRTGDVGEAFKQSLSELRYTFDDDYDPEYGSILNRPAYRAEWGQILRSNNGIIGKKLLDAGFGIYEETRATNPWEAMMKWGDLIRVVADKDYRTSEAARLNTIPLSSAENYQLAALGLMADIMLDPLTYTGVGFIGKGARALKGGRFLRGVETTVEAEFRARKALNTKLADPQQDVAIRRANLEEDLEKKIGATDESGKPFIEEDMHEQLRIFDMEETAAEKALLEPRRTKLGKVIPSLREEGYTVPEGVSNHVNLVLSTMGKLDAHLPKRGFGGLFIQNNVIKRLQNPATAATFRKFLKENAEEIAGAQGANVDKGELVEHLTGLSDEALDESIQNNASKYLGFVNKASLDSASESQAIKNAMLHMTKVYGLDARYAMSLLAANTKSAKRMIDEGPGDADFKEKMYEMLNLVKSLTKEMTDKDLKHGLLDQTELRSDYLPSRAPLSAAGERTMRRFLETSMDSEADIEHIMQKIMSSEGRQSFFSHMEGDVKATFQNKATYKDLYSKLLGLSPSEMDYALLYGNRSFESLRLRNTKKFQEYILNDRTLTIPVDMAIATDKAHPLHKKFLSKGFDFYSPAGEWKGEGAVFYAMPKDMVNALKTTNELMEGAVDVSKSGGWSKLWKQWQMGTTLWRQWALGSWGYVARNVQSNIFTNYVAGVTNPVRYLEAAMLQWGGTDNMPRGLRSYVEFKVGGPKVIQDYKFKLKDGRVLSLKDMRSEMDKHGIFAQTFSTNEMAELAGVESAAYGIYHSARTIPVGAIREGIQGMPSWGDTKERVNNATRHIQEVFASIKNEEISKEEAHALAELYDGMARQWAWYSGGVPAEWWNKLTIEGFSDFNQVKSKYVEQNIFDVLPQAATDDSGWKPWWDEKTEAMPALRSMMASFVEEESKRKKSIWRKDESGEQMLTFAELKKKLGPVIEGSRTNIPKTRLVETEKKGKAWPDDPRRLAKEKEWTSLRHPGEGEEFMMFDDWLNYAVENFPNQKITKNNLVNAMDRGLFRVRPAELSQGQMLSPNGELALEQRLDDGQIIFGHRLPQLSPRLSHRWGLEPSSGLTKGEADFYGKGSPLTASGEPTTESSFGHTFREPSSYQDDIRYATSPMRIRLNPSNKNDQIIWRILNPANTKDFTEPLDLTIRSDLSEVLIDQMIKNGSLDKNVFYAADPVAGHKLPTALEPRTGAKYRRGVGGKLQESTIRMRDLEEPKFGLDNSSALISEALQNIVTVGQRLEKPMFAFPDIILQNSIKLSRVKEGAAGYWFRQNSSGAYMRPHNIHKKQLPITSKEAVLSARRKDELLQTEDDIRYDPWELDDPRDEARAKEAAKRAQGAAYLGESRGRSDVGFRTGYIVAEGMPSPGASIDEYRLAAEGLDQGFVQAVQHDLGPKARFEEVLEEGPFMIDDATQSGARRSGYTELGEEPFSPYSTRQNAIGHYKISDYYPNPDNDDKYLVLHELQSDYFQGVEENMGGWGIPLSPGTFPMVAQKLLIQEAAKGGYKKIIWASNLKQVATAQAWGPAAVAKYEYQRVADRYIKNNERGGVGDTFRKIIHRVDAKADDLADPAKAVGERPSLKLSTIEHETGKYNAIDISEDLSNKALNGGMTFFQKEKSGEIEKIKGLTNFLDSGRATIVAFKSGDVSTMIHELAHLARRSNLLENGDKDVINRWIFGMGEPKGRDLVKKRLEAFSEDAYGEARPLGRQFSEDDTRDFVDQIMWPDPDPLPGEKVNAEEKFALAIEKYILEGALKPVGLSSNHISAIERLTISMKEIYETNGMEKLLPDELPMEVKQKINNLLGQGVEAEPEKGELFSQMVELGQIEDPHEAGVGQRAKNYLFGLEGETVTRGWKDPATGERRVPLSAEGLKRVLGNNAYLRFTRGAARITEHNARGALFIQSMLDGMTGAEAAFNVKKYLFDYSELTDFEKNVMRNIIPFYTWLRKNIPLQIESIINRPAKYASAAKARAELGELSQVEYQDDPATPDYFKENLATRLPFMIDHQPTYAVPDLPYLDIETAEGILDLNAWIGRMHPILKTTYELVANEKTMTGAPIRKEYGADDPTFVGDIDLTAIYGPNMDHLVNSLLPPASKIKSITRDLSKGKSPLEVWGRVAGVPIRTVDVDAVVRHRRFEFQKKGSTRVAEIKGRIRKRAKLMGLNIGTE